MCVSRGARGKRQRQRGQTPRRAYFVVFSLFSFVRKRRILSFIKFRISVARRELTCNALASNFDSFFFCRSCPFFLFLFFKVFPAVTKTATRASIWNRTKRLAQEKAKEGEGSGRTPLRFSTDGKLERLHIGRKIGGNGRDNVDKEYDLTFLWLAFSRDKSLQR